MSTTFEQRATSAGAALRAAFELDAAPGAGDQEGLHMTTTTSTRVEAAPVTLAPRRRRGTALAAAGLTAAAVAAGVLVLPGLGDEPADRLTPATPGATVLTGLRGVPDFPVEITVPPSLREVDEDAGSRAFVLADEADGDGGVVVTGLRSVDGVPAADLPDRLAPLVDARPDVEVTDVGTRTLGGVTGESFTLSVPAGATPADLWCPVEELLCFKLAPGMTADVVVLPTAAGPLWVLVEATPEGRDAVHRAAVDLLAGLRITAQAPPRS